MFNFIKTTIGSLLGLNRRRLKRIPCNIKAHFFVISRKGRKRGSATITDITREGICCDETHFFHEDKEFRMARNSNLEIYFALPAPDSGQHNFEITATIRAIKVKDPFSHSRRLALKIKSIKRNDRKNFNKCVAYLTEKYLTEKKNS